MLSPPVRAHDLRVRLGAPELWPGEESLCPARGAGGAFWNSQPSPAAPARSGEPFVTRARGKSRSGGSVDLCEADRVRFLIHASQGECTGEAKTALRCPAAARDSAACNWDVRINRSTNSSSAKRFNSMRTAFHFIGSMRSRKGQARRLGESTAGFLGSGWRGTTACKTNGLNRKPFPQMSK